MNNKGKLTFTGIIVIALIFYGAYIAVQLITTAITEKEIAKRVKEKIGIERGYSFTNSKAEEFIHEILSKEKGIIYNKSNENAIFVKIDKETTTILYYFEYSTEINYLFYKKRRKIKVEDTMASYR